VDEKAKKYTLRMVPYGLYVLTASTEDGTDAATVSWLTQASFDPPRIIVGLRKETGIWQRVLDAGSFAVNVLGEGQKDVASAFSRHREPGDNPLGDEPSYRGVTGAPILNTVPAYVECRTVEVVDAGDHSLFLADIVEAGVQNDQPALALTDTGWHYGG
jgi:flavin reductase (DIM6/NTAB) family NADH-FMN oxidoreductase RutF